MPRKKKQISFEVSGGDASLIDLIVQRAIDEGIATESKRLDLTMDLTATHANGTPLKLAEMLKGRRFDVAHDIYGIRQHLDRETGELGGCFLPRFARPTA